MLITIPAVVKVELLMRTCIYALLCLTLHTFAANIEGRVVGVADGDTITVLDAVKIRHKIRLSGIDAPEKGNHSGSARKKA